MKGDRLLSTLLLLQANGRMTGRDLARRLEVSQRTVHRDMEALSAAGVPIYALRGAQGGWQLDEEWRTQVPGLDDAELRALLISQPRITGDARLAAAAESSISKLMAALPAAMRTRAAAIRQRLFIDTRGWRGAVEDLKALHVVQEAVWTDRKLTFRYHQRGGEPEERTVDPLGLIAKGTAWYLYASTPRGFRTYRVSRMVEPRVLDQPAGRPANFDLATHWKASEERFQEERQRYRATLHLDSRASDWVRAWHNVSFVQEGPWNTVEVEFQCEDEAAFVVLGLASHARVVAPESLRDRVEAEKRADGRTTAATV
jgi:predicted DNA-binding transcriptional regulator YafY